MMNAIDDAIRATFPVVCENTITRWGDRTYTISIIETIIYAEPAPACVGFTIEILIKSEGGIIDIKQYDTKWIYKDAHLIREEDVGSPFLESIFKAYFAGWAAAVKKLIAKHQFPDVITPWDIVPTRSKCPLKLAGNGTLDAAYFEERFLAKSRLPSLQLA